MCISADGQQVLCDGRNCLAKTMVPVALRNTLKPVHGIKAAEGWLFVIRHNASLHYCPICAAELGGPHGGEVFAVPATQNIRHGTLTNKEKNNENSARD